MSSLRINKRYTTIPMSVVRTTIPTLSQYFSLRPATSGFRHNRTSASSLTDRAETVNHLPTGNAIVPSDWMVRSPVIISRFRSMYVVHVNFRQLVLNLKILHRIPTSRISVLRLTRSDVMEKLQSRFRPDPFHVSLTRQQPRYRTTRHLHDDGGCRWSIL